MPELGALARLAELGIADATIQRGDDGRLRASGIGRVPVTLPEQGAEPSWLQLPVQAEATAGEGGELCFSVLPPDAEVLAEGQAYVRSHARAWWTGAGGQGCEAACHARDRGRRTGAALLAAAGVRVGAHRSGDQRDNERIPSASSGSPTAQASSPSR